MPSLIAASATRQPILPRPMMPSVLAGQLDAGEGLLAVLDRLVEVGASPASSRATKRSAGAQVARRHQHAGQHQLLDRVGVGARRVEHRHAARAHRRHRDVVGAGAGAADGLHAGRDRPCACMSAERTRIASGVGDVLADAVARRPAGASGRCGEIWFSTRICKRWRLSHVWPRTPACSRPAPARPRSASRCRSTRACRRPSGGP